MVGMNLMCVRMSMDGLRIATPSLRVGGSMCVCVEFAGHIRVLKL